VSPSKPRPRTNHRNNRQQSADGSTTVTDSGPSNRNTPQNPGGKSTRFGVWLLVVIGLIAGVVFQMRRTSVDSKPVPAAQVDPSLIPPTGHAGPAAFATSRSNVAISPDGSLTAWAFDSNELTVCLGLWDDEEPDLSQQITLRGHTERIHQIAFSGFGDLIGTAGKDGVVKVWETGSGQEIVSLEDHDGPVNAVTFSPDGVSMATGGEDGTVRLWDAYGGLPLATLCELASPITALAYNPKGNWLAAASRKGSLQIWEMETGRKVLELPRNDSSPIDRIMFSPDGDQLVASGDPSRLERWRSGDGQTLPTITLEGNQILGFAFSPGSEAIAVSGIDRRLLVTNLKNDSILADIKTPEIPLLMQYAGDGVLRWSKLSRDDIAKMGERDLAASLAALSGLAESAIDGFEAPDGLEFKVFADETMVSNPAAICFDEQGAMYIAETFRFDTEVSLGYAGRESWLLDDLKNQTPADRLAMYEKFAANRDGGMTTHTKFSERIRRLEDTNQDGKADKSTIFADDFCEPLTGTGTGLLSVDHQIIYTCIPNLWTLSDRDGDGKSDKREAILTGFGVKASLPHGLHGLTRGPDGKIYFSIGDRGFMVKTKEGSTLHTPSTGAILRCNPDGTELQQIATGFRNPQELVFDDYGNLFTCDNNSNQGDQARLIYVLPGIDAGWEMAFETMPADYPLGPWNMDQLWQTTEQHGSAAVIPALAHIGIGPAGFTHYPGVGLPNRYQDHFFLCDFADAPETSGIRSFALKPQGAGFSVVDQHTFVGNILPTDIEFGPDQNIYITDWIRGADSDGMGRIYSAKFQSKINEDSVSVKGNWLTRDISNLPIEQLVDKLEHPDQRYRQRAQFVLADRGEASIDLLIRTLQTSENQLARIHSIWALGMIAKQSPAQKESCMRSVMDLLTDSDSEIRAQCSRVLGEVAWQESAQKLIDKLADSDSRVRAMAALSLGELRASEATDALLTVLRANADADPFLRHAASWALSKTTSLDELETKSNDPDRSVRLGILLAMRRIGAASVTRFLDDPETELVLEAARAIYDLPIQSALNDLANHLLIGPDLESFQRRSINANLKLRDENSAHRLIDLIDREDVPSSTKSIAIQAIKNWTQPPERDPVMGTIWLDDQPSVLETAKTSAANVIEPWLRETLQEKSLDLDHELMLAAESLEIEVGDASWIIDPQRDPRSRLLLLNRLADSQSNERDLAIQNASKSESSILQIRAAELLSVKDPDGATKILIDLLGSGNEREQQRALTALGEINSPQVDQLLVGMLHTFSSGGIAPTIKYEVLSIANERQSPSVQRALANVLGYLGQQTSLAAKYQAVLQGGSAERGRLLFEHHTALQCVRCHQIDDLGGRVGPNLSNIGGRVSREYLLESLLDPEKQIAKGYEGVLVALSDGSTVSGVIESETDSQLQLMRQDGSTVQIKKSEITQRRGGRSVMPNNLLEHVNSSDLRDLLEYLASRK